jgi:hypothetical protein
MTMVVVPFVAGRLQPATWTAVTATRGAAQFVCLDSGDDGGYGRLVRRLWARGADVIICEQDVAPTLEHFEQLEACPRPWCSFPYHDHMYADGPMFGLVRFRSALMAEHPMAADVALEGPPRRPAEVGWWECDSMLARDLMIRGAVWHRHTPPVQHVHPGGPSGRPRQ